MKFFDHKDLGNHLLQLCPKVVKHPVYLPVQIKIDFFTNCVLEFKKPTQVVWRLRKLIQQNNVGVSSLQICFSVVIPASLAMSVSTLNLS